MIILNMYIIYTDSLSLPWFLPKGPLLENLIYHRCWISRSYSCSQLAGFASLRRIRVSPLFLCLLCCLAAGNLLLCCLCPGIERSTMVWRCSLSCRSRRILGECRNWLCCLRGGIGKLCGVFLSIWRIRGWKDRGFGSLLWLMFVE